MTVVDCLKDEDASYRAMAEGSPDALLLFDDAGVITFLHPAAEALFGRRAAELKSLPQTRP